jgi:hypothetical protein
MTNPVDRLGHNVNEPADWVDKALPNGSKAAAIPGLIGSYPRTRLSWWDVEFWNKAVDRVFDYPPAWLDTPFATDPLSVNWRTGALETDKPLRYAVVPRFDRRFRPAGTALARTSYLELIKVRQPPSAAWALRGTDSDGWTGPNSPAFVHVFGNSATSAARVKAIVQLTSSPTSHSRQRFDIAGGQATVRGKIAPHRVENVPVPLCLAPKSNVQLTLRVRDSVRLSSGKRAGLAVTGVHISPDGTCART